MSALCWCLVNLVSRALAPDERDAVRGDLYESGDNAGDALFQVLGLVVRRQAALWTRWRPWAALFLAMPLGILFGLVTKVIAYNGAIYLWVYTNYWSWTIVENAAYRNGLIDFVASTLIGYGILAVLAWCCGRAIGSVSRGGLLVNGVVFSGLLFFGDVLNTPGPNSFSANAVVFEHAFYRFLFPLLLQTLLILVPSLFGMHQSLSKLKENHS
jgi:hypothetical protein